MKSSRQRFAEFREKLRKGKLDPDRLSDPAQKKDAPVNMGGHSGGGRWGGGGGGHGMGGGGGSYTLKHKKKKLLSEYRVMLKGYYGPVAMLLIFSMIGSILSLVTPGALKFLLDYVVKGKSLRDVTQLSWIHSLPGTPYGSLLVVVGVLAATAGMSIALDWLRLLAQQRINYRLAGSLRLRLHTHLSTLPLSQLADYKTGGIVSRIMGDTDQVVGGVQNAIVNPLNATFRITLTIIAIIFMAWKLAVAAAILIPPIVAIHFLIFRRLRPMWRNIQDDRSTLSGKLTDMYGGIRVVRSFRRERWEWKEFNYGQDTMIRKQQYTAVLGRLLNTGWNTFGPAIGIVIVWFGGLQVLKGVANGGMEIGTLIAFQTLILQLISPISQMIDSFQNLQQNLGALDRVVDVLEQPSDMPDVADAKPLTRAQGHIELDGVQFGYKPEKKIIDGVSLEVPAGTTLAIVGPSGSGKTTLVNLVARFFDVQTGSISIDSVDIRALPLDYYRSLFAMVLQDVYLFDGTVAENIAYGKRHATRAEIEEAARKANAHEFILSLEKGYETIVGERGNKLSGGQKQRISIARAILADPRVLILDEATSSLDTASEHLIQQSLKDLMLNRTTFVIAHRLSTIMHADRIVVLVEGRIVEEGTHDELMERRGVYHTMFTQQFERQKDGAMERMEWELESKA